MSMKNSTKSKNINSNQLNNIIKGSDTLLKLFSCLIIAVIICILIGKYAFKNGNLTCDHYVFNTYLYIILAILIIFIVVLVNDQYGIFNNLILWMMSGGTMRIYMVFIIYIILIFALTYALMTVNPTNIIASNLIWLLVLIFIAFIIIPTIWFGRLTGVVGIAGILTLVITIVVGLLGYYNGDSIVTFNWNIYLNYALMILIAIIILGPYFISTSEGMNNFIVVISFISLIIFILLLLANHKKLKENADKCIDGKVVPNYPLESYGIVIKIVNIFQDLINILGRSQR
uniref:Inhibitor of apoptosis-promoting Bax1 n=1 Tax=viral metagenome TaxID=1070528 RepID=A0A6C0EZY9_9ZZZZ